MEFDELSTSQELEIKRPCANCPRLAILTEHLEQLEDRKVALGNSAQDPRLEEMAELLTATLIDPTTGLQIEMQSTDLVKGIRGQAAGELDHLDGHIDEIREGAAKLQAGCPGAHGSRSVSKSGRLVTLYVCDSPLAIESGEIEPARIFRS